MGFKKPTTSVEEARERSNARSGISKPTPAASAANNKAKADDKHTTEPKQLGAPQSVTKQASKPKTAGKVSDPSLTTSSGSIRLSVTIYAPKRSIFPAFDRLAENEGEKQALKLILYKAFPIYEAALAEDKVGADIAQYEFSDSSISTTRTVSMQSYRLIKARHDPMDLKRNSTIGRAYAIEAVAIFLQMMDSD